MALHFQANDGYLEGPDVLEQSVLGTELYVYSGRGGCVSMLVCFDPNVDVCASTESLALTLFGDSSFTFL